MFEFLIGVRGININYKQCQQVTVDVFSDQSGVVLLKAMAERDHN